MVKKYDYTVVATDVVLFTLMDGKLHVLLMEMSKAPFEKCWAVPGGLVKPEESIDESASRIIAEKSGKESEALEQLATFGRVNRDPFGRVVSVAYMGLVNEHGASKVVGSKSVVWFPIDKLPSLAYDHAEIVKTAYRRLSSKLEYSNIARGLLPRIFPLSDLQRVYEIVLHRSIDKRNFRKKVLETGLVAPTGKIQRQGASRPAQLYRFVSCKSQVIHIL